MLPVIIGKSKTVVEPMPSNLLVIGGSFTGRLKIYDRDTMQEVTGIDTSAMTNINSLAYDNDYIYVGGTFTATPHARKISRATRAISIMASGAPNTALATNAMVSDNGAIYTAPASNASGRLYKINVAGGSSNYAALARYGCLSLAQDSSYLYFYANYNSSSYYIMKFAKPSLSFVASLALSSFNRVLTVDSNFLYFGSTNSGDFHVYDLALTTEQTGYPTVPGGIYSILNDDTNIYIESSENVYVINKATKALTTVALGVAGTVRAMTQDAEYVYVAISSRILAFSKSTLSGVSTYKELGTPLTNAIMVI